MVTIDASAQFAGGVLGRHRHICAFFNSTDEEHRVLRSFIKDGFDRGDKAFHLVNPELREEHLKRLADAFGKAHVCTPATQWDRTPSHACQINLAARSRNAWVAPSAPA